MVCLESAILEAPNMFTSSLIDPSNQLMRVITISPSLGIMNTVQDYWGTDNICKAVTNELYQTNTKSMKAVLTNTINASMIHIDQVAKFLCEFISQTKAFRCYLGPVTINAKNTVTYHTYSGDTQPAYISPTIDDQGNQYLEGYLGNEATYPITFSDPITWQMVSNKLQSHQV